MSDIEAIDQIRKEAYQAGYAAAIEQAKRQEPDYWLSYGLQAYTEKPHEDATPLYTSPPIRELSDEEIMEVWDEVTPNEVNAITYARAILKKAQP